MSTQTPNHSVRIVLLDELGRFPLVEERDDIGNPKFTGGKIEPGELPDDAATRELGEELGLNPEDVNLRKVGVLPNDDGVSERHLYTGNWSAATVMHPGPDISKIVVANLGSIPEDSRHAAHIRAAAAYVIAAVEADN